MLSCIKETCSIGYEKYRNEGELSFGNHLLRIAFWNCLLGIAFWNCLLELLLLLELSFNGKSCRMKLIIK